MNTEIYVWKCKIRMASVENGDVQITVHPLTDNPTAAWHELSKGHIARKIEPLPLDLPVSESAVRFICISDTHSLTTHMKAKLPEGDILIHAGDFTRYGNYNEVKDFNNFLGSLPYKHKVVIAGNHELSFDSFENTLCPSSIISKHLCGKGQVCKKVFKCISKDSTTSLLTNCTYLQDSGTKICGISIYGSPWQPEYGGWAFNLPRGMPLLEKWNEIPTGIDVLVTHSPPVGHGDWCRIGVHAGCVELLNTVQKRVKPKYHVFGHIHEGYGITTDGHTIFINASICTVNYTPSNLPIIFDIPLPDGCSKG